MVQKTLFDEKAFKIKVQNFEGNYCCIETQTKNVSDANSAQLVRKLYSKCVREFVLFSQKANLQK